MPVDPGLIATGACEGVSPEIFRAYDIRGTYADQLDQRSIRLIGQAIGSEALDAGIDTLLFGRDGRLSSPQLAEHLVDGVRSSGCHVVDLGLVPTPLVYFATHTTAWSSGIMLTASHNPANYNGVKIVFQRSCLADNQIQHIRHRTDESLFHHGSGNLEQLDIKAAYLDYVTSNIRLDRKLKLVIDCANAATSVIAPELFEALGCEVVPLFCDLDGRFPNHDPDPTQGENLFALRSQVVAEGADLGLAFDGDGDRLAAVSSDGEAVDTDLLLATLIEAIVPNHPGKPVIFDVKCSSRLAALIESHGGRPVMHRSGHSFMKQKMQETDAPLGGEYSAHIFIKDRWFGFDDGMYTAARLLEIVSQAGGPSAEAFTSLGERYATPEMKIPVREQDKFGLMSRLKNAARFPDARVIDLDGIRVEFPDGWGLVRASNTSPALLLRFEADSPRILSRIQNDFRQLLLQIDKSLPISF